MSRKISIVVTYLPVNNDEVKYLTDQCLQRIKANTYNSYELVFVSNGSTLLGEEADIKIQNKENLGNANAWDQGIGASSGDIIILMDNDCWPMVENWEKEMVEKLSDPTIGVTFPYSIVLDERDRMEAGLSVEYRGRRDGFCFAFRREIYEETGPFLCGQPFELGYYEDDLFEYKVQYMLGLKLVACKTSLAWHKSQATAKAIWNKEIEEGIQKNKKWYEDLTDGVYPNIEK